MWILPLIPDVIGNSRRISGSMTKFDTSKGEKHGTSAR